MPLSAPPLFNKAHSRAHRHRAEQENNMGADFLLRWAETETLNRLQDIKRSFEKCLLLSPSPGDLFTEKLEQKVETFDVLRNSSLTDDEILSVPENTYDLILSFFDLYKTNDPLGWLIQMNRALKEDGAMIACTTGGDTLYELKQSMMLAEIETMGGASPRILPFATKEQLANLMQRAGFALPVIDSETLTGSYRDLYHLMSDLRGMGETNCLKNRYKFFTPSRLFYEAAKIYDEEFSDTAGRINATFEIIFLIGWSPSDTQPKPLRKGSGQIPLGSVLED